MLVLLALPIIAHADFTQLYGQYNSSSDFTPLSTYSPKLALLSAAASDDVYLSDGHSAALENAGFYNFQARSTSTDTQAIIAVKEFQGKRIIAIIFRGTSNFADVMSDLDILGAQFNSSSSEIKVHKGFLDATNSFKDIESSIPVYGGKTLDTVISEQNSDDIYFIAGHSLGGAIATLYSAQLRDRNIPAMNIITYTFGSPAVGNDKFVDNYNDLHLHRIRNLYDPIPYSAYLVSKYNPLLPTYFHIGHLRIYDNGSIIASQPPVVLEDLKLSDHYLSVYKSDVGWNLNDSFSVATSVPYSTVVADTLIFNGQKNYYTLTIPTAGKYFIYNRGPTRTTATLYDSDYNSQTSIFASEYSGESGNFRMEVTLSPGTYYLEVKGGDSNTVGSYKLHIDGQGAATTEDRDDHGFSPWNATPVTVGSVTPGTLDLRNDRDYFRFTIPTAGKYFIYNRGPTRTTATLYDSDYNSQTSIFASEYSGESGNFRMEVTLSPGTYYLEVKGGDSNTVGSYKLHIDGQGAATTEDRDDHGFSPWNATPVTVGSVTPGTLDLRNDRDYFRFTIPTAGKYFIYNRGPTRTTATLYDSDYNSQTSIFASEYSGESGNFRMEVTLSPGTYYLEVKGGDSNTVGSYKLHIDGQGAATTEDRDDHGFSPWNATPVTVGSVTPGTLDLRNDRDYFRFTIPTAGKYFIYNRGPTRTTATLYDSDYNSQTSIFASEYSGEWQQISGWKLLFHQVPIILR